MNTIISDMNTPDNNYKFNINDLGESMYVSDFVCTYMFIKDLDESTFCYRLQLLEAFNCNEFNDKIINKTTKYLYEKYKDNKYLSNIIQYQLTKFSINDDEKLSNELLIFRTLFSYDTFYLFHSILCSLINNTDINVEKYNKLIN